MHGRRKNYRAGMPSSAARSRLRRRNALPEDDLVFFLLDLVPQIDLSPFHQYYAQELRGQPPFDLAMMVSLLLYAYCVGVYSSRKIATACERNLAFLAIVGTDRPDFRTVSDFRKLHLETFADTFTQVLRLAKEAGLVKLGVLATDGTKLAGNASRHKAMSYGYMTKEVERLRPRSTPCSSRPRSRTRPTMRRWAAGAATNCRTNCNAAKTAWRRCGRPSSAWRRRPAPRPRPSGNAARKPRRNDSVAARNAGAGNRARSTKRRTPRRRRTSPIPS